MGREAGGQRWGPRPLDLDIIFYDDITSEEEGLEIPHPRWHERSFVQVRPSSEPQCSIFEHSAGCIKVVESLLNVKGEQTVRDAGPSH